MQDDNRESYCAMLAKNGVRAALARPRLGRWNRSSIYNRSIITYTFVYYGVYVIDCDKIALTLIFKSALFAL